MKHQKNKAFTLVELLVVLVIISILLGLLLPAVQQIREAARRGVCENNLKQLALACLNHEHNVGSLPSGGWATTYVGDSDLGLGLNQPGSWLFSLLPYIEQNDTFMLAADGDRMNITQKQKEGAYAALTTPIKTFLCPSRRSVGLYPCQSGLWRKSVQNSSAFPTASGAAGTVDVVKTDYIANGGYYCLNDKTGIDPANIQTQTNSTLPAWDDWVESGGVWNRALWDANTTSFDSTVSNNNNLDGVIFRHSAVKLDNISDGTSNTYLLGEKFMMPRHYTGVSNQDLMYAYAGTYAIASPSSRPRLDWNMVETDGSGNVSADGGARSNWGSPHVGAMGMAFCDGSVHRVSYNIPDDVHLNLARRNDKNAITTLSEFVK